MEIEMCAALNCLRSRVLVELQRNGGLVMLAWICETAREMAFNRDEPTIDPVAWVETLLGIIEFLEDQRGPWLDRAEALELLDVYEEAICSDADADARDEDAIRIAFKVAELNERSGQ